MLDLIGNREEECRQSVSGALGGVVAAGAGAGVVPAASGSLVTGLGSTLAVAGFTGAGAGAVS